MNINVHRSSDNIVHYKLMSSQPFVSFAASICDHKPVAIATFEQQQIGNDPSTRFLLLLL